MAREVDGCREIFSELFSKYGKACVSKKEACGILGVSPATMTRMVANKTIKSIGNNISLWNIARILVQ